MGYGWQGTALSVQWLNPRLPAHGRACNYNTLLALIQGCMTCICNFLVTVQPVLMRRLA